MKFSANSFDSMQSETHEPFVEPPFEHHNDSYVKPHLTNKNIYGNVQRVHCDENIDEKQGWIAISIIAVCVCATFLVYRGTEIWVWKEANSTKL